MYAKHYRSGYKIPHLFSDKEEEEGEREEEMVNCIYKRCITS